MQQIASFLKIAQILKSKGISFINLKGPLLSQRIYDDPTYRYSRDFDILVQPEQVHQTLRVLQVNGFRFPDFQWPSDPKKQEIILHFLNQVEMIHHESGLMIEVHWKLFSTRIIDPEILQNLVRKHTEPIEFGGIELNQFTNEFELFYLVVHGGVHAWFRLKWLVDIHEFLHRIPVDLQTFDQIITESKSEKLVGICNFMLNKHYPDTPDFFSSYKVPVKLSKIALEQCRQPEGDPHIDRRNTFKLLAYRMKLYSSIRYKADLLKVITFYKYDLEIDWLPTSKIVYYLFRPFGFLLRKIGWFT